MELRLTSVRRGFGHEGEPIYQGKIAVGKNAFAEFREDGHGGSMCVDPVWDAKYKIKHPQLWEQWLEHVRTADLKMPAWRNGVRDDTDLIDVTYERDSFIVARLLDQHLQDQQINRWCRTGVVYRLETDPKGEFRIYKCSADVRANIITAVRTKFGAELERIYNE